jgi:hypothetical protein
VSRSSLDFSKTSIFFPMIKEQVNKEGKKVSSQSPDYGLISPLLILNLFSANKQQKKMCIMKTSQHQHEDGWNNVNNQAGCGMVRMVKSV